MIHLSLQNIGGRILNISKIECTINCTDINGNTSTITANTYYTLENPPRQLILPWLILKPEDQWNETVHFYHYFEEDEKDRAIKIMSKIDADYNKEIQEKNRH